MIINVIKDKEFWERLQKAVTEVNDFLYRYCGPFANNVDMKQIIADGAQLANDNSNLMDRFTKDGISIVAHLTTNDEIQRMYLRWVTHVGRLVDSACHDGTTTAMLAFGNIVKHVATVMAEHSQPESNLYNERNRVQFAHVFKKVIKSLEEVIDYHTWNVDKVEERLSGLGVEFTRKELIYGIVFHQTLLSSKGDVKLADKMAEFLTLYPEELKGKVDFGNTRLETPEPYYLLERKGDYTFKCEGVYSVFYNNKQDYCVDYKDCNLITLTGGFVVNENPLVNVICAAMLEDPQVREAFLFIKSNIINTQAVVKDPAYQLSSYGLTSSFIDPSHPFIILAMEGNLGDHPVLSQLCYAYRAVYPQSPVIPVKCFIVPALVSVTTRGFVASAGKIPFDEVFSKHEDFDKAIIHGVDIYSKYDEVILENVYAERSDDVNGYYLDKTKNPVYTEILQEIQDKIKATQLDHLRSKRSNDNIPKYIDLYRQMTHAHLKDLRLGGLTYDMVANDHVVEDAAGSSQSSLNEGFVFTGYCKLAEWCVRQWAFSQLGSNESEAYEIFAKAFLDTLEATYRSPKENIELFLQYMTSPEMYLRCDPIHPLPDRAPMHHRLFKTIDRFANMEVKEGDEDKEEGEKVFGETMEGIEKETEQETEWFWKNVCVAIDFTQFLVPIRKKKEALEKGIDPITVLKDIDPIPLQPAAGYKQGLMRYQSLLPHLVNTNAYLHTEER